MSPEEHATRVGKVFLERRAAHEQARLLAAELHGLGEALADLASCLVRDDPGQLLTDEEVRAALARLDISGHVNTQQLRTLLEAYGKVQKHISEANRLLGE